MKTQPANRPIERTNSIRCCEINRLQITVEVGKLREGRSLPQFSSIREDACFWSCPSPSRQHGYLAACNGVFSQSTASFRLFPLPSSHDSGLSPLSTSRRGLCGPRELLGMFLKMPIGYHESFTAYFDLIYWGEVPCTVPDSSARISRA